MSEIKEICRPEKNESETELEIKNHRKLKKVPQLMTTKEISPREKWILNEKLALMEQLRLIIVNKNYYKQLEPRIKIEITIVEEKWMGEKCEEMESEGNSKPI